jgi:hypothetical protein
VINEKISEYSENAEYGGIEKSPPISVRPCGEHGIRSDRPLIHMAGTKYFRKKDGG